MMIPYGKQSIDQKDIDAVLEVLKSEFLTQGPQVPLFEKAISKYCTANYCVAVNSATSALHLSCLALGVGENDSVWTSPITFVASANCARYCRARVDFVDIDPETYNMDPVALEKKLEEAQKNGCLPKVIIFVHLGGQGSGLSQIHKIARMYNVKLIEDASHAIGAKYKGFAVGSCKYSDISVFSFHPVKIITTAEGGAAVTNDPELAFKMKLLRTHGITRDENCMSKISDGPWYYQQLCLGYNYRLTDLQAALGISQLSKIDAFTLRRNEIASLYDRYLKELPLKFQKMEEEVYSSFHLYLVRIKSHEVNLSHKKIVENLRKNKIGVNIHYIPVHLQPYYSKLGFKAGDFPESESYYSETLSLPIYPTLSNDQIKNITTIIRKIIS